MIKRAFGAALVLLALAGPVIAAPAYYRAKVVTVVDGDTVKVTVAAWKNSPFYNIDVRINGIDTPETMKQFAKCPGEVVLGNAARIYAKTLVQPGDDVKLFFKNFDKYGGRIDADLILKGNKSFGKEMIESGFAVAYSGGTKKDWCK